MIHITLRQLEIFAKVVKSGSTSQAAQQLALSQSAISSALSELENQLGVLLFDRPGKRLRVNEYGRLLYPRVLMLLEQAGEITQLFSDADGALRVFASSTIGNYILPEIIARYRRDLPNLPLEINIGNSREVIKAVMELRADIGLVEAPCHIADIVTKPWMEDELVVFSAPDNHLLQQPITLEHLANASWILRELGSGTRTFVDYVLQAHLPKFQSGMELGNSEAIKYTVCHGLSISCLSRRVIADQLRNGTLVEVPAPLPRLVRTLYCIHHRQKHISKALQRFLQYCQCPL